jgi:polyisoprenoid-binding protein YceI
MKKVLLLALVALTALPMAASAKPDAFTVDTGHSGVSFQIRHFFSEVPGRFTDFTGKIVWDAEKPEASSVEITVQAKSINTDNTNRDGHLQSPDFFDVANHPTMTFKSTSVKAKDDKTLSVTGDLTVKGVTKKTTIEVVRLGVMELGGGKAKAGFKTSFTIDRKEFGITWNKTLDAGGTVLGDEVPVTVLIEADRAVAAN